MLSNGGVQLAAEDAGGAAGAREVPARHHRPAEDSRHGPVALPAVQPEAAAAAAIVERLDASWRRKGSPTSGRHLALLARAAARARCATRFRLLDQAIAYGGGDVRAEIVATMLGAVDVEHVFRIADAVLAGDGVALLAEADALAERNLSAAAALEQLASLYHRIAIAQAVPAATGELEDAERIADFASRIAPEAVQLAYQICVQGRADLALAPDETMGFSMTLLRLLAFEPVAASPLLTLGRPRVDPGSRCAALRVAAAPAPARATPVAQSVPNAALRRRPPKLSTTTPPMRWPGLCRPTRASGWR